LEAAIAAIDRTSVPTTGFDPVYGGNGPQGNFGRAVVPELTRLNQGAYRRRQPAAAWTSASGRMAHRSEAWPALTQPAKSLETLVF
jgi:hypothetical protein